MIFASRLQVVLISILLVACVLGCKMGGAATTSTNENTAAPQNPHRSASDKPLPNIAGKYNITGKTLEGNPYRGTLEVLSRGDVYQFRWNSGGQYDGIGIPHGNVIAVAFANGPNGKGCGVVDYIIESDGTLDGKWGYWGVNESGTERAVRTSGSGLIGEYDATGKNPDGRQYKASLTVEPAVDLFRFKWSNDTDGVGIKQGNNVAVGIGGPRCGFVAYQVTANGTLDGVWGIYGQEKTGTERAIKQ